MDYGILIPNDETSSIEDPVRGSNAYYYSLIRYYDAVFFGYFDMIAW